MDEENKKYMMFYTELGDGRFVAVQVRLYNHILMVGQADDDFGYDSHWCYKELPEAIAAAIVWAADGAQGEPDGWFRHAASGRRRPDGDKSKEYIEY